jgi:hypothetical protein
MKDLSILYPVFVQVLLTFLLQMWMGRERLSAVRAKTVRRGEHEGAKPVWPERAAVVSNAFHNQLEMPMLFYAVVAFALITGAADGILLALAWAFAISRLVHAGVYTTYNKIEHRFLVYLFGAMVVWFMWGLLAFRVMTGGA